MCCGPETKLRGVGDFGGSFILGVGVATQRVNSLNCSLNSSAFYYMHLYLEVEFFLKEEMLQENKSQENIFV